MKTSRRLLIVFVLVALVGVLLSYAVPEIQAAEASDARTEGSDSVLVHQGLRFTAKEVPHSEPWTNEVVQRTLVITGQLFRLNQTDDWILVDHEFDTPRVFLFADAELEPGQRYRVDFYNTAVRGDLYLKSVTLDVGADGSVELLDGEDSQVVSNTVDIVTIVTLFERMEAHVLAADSKRVHFYRTYQDCSPEIPSCVLEESWLESPVTTSTLGRPESDRGECMYMRIHAAGFFEYQAFGNNMHADLYSEYVYREQAPGYIASSAGSIVTSGESTTWKGYSSGGGAVITGLDVHVFAAVELLGGTAVVAQSFMTYEMLTDFGSVTYNQGNHVPLLYEDVILEEMNGKTIRRGISLSTPSFGFWRHIWSWGMVAKEIRHSRTTSDVVISYAPGKAYSGFASGVVFGDRYEENQPPVALFDYSPESPLVGQEVRFDSSSYDPDGEIVKYHWDFGDGNTREEVAPAGRVVTHTYTEPEPYTVTLTVTDDDGLTDAAQKDLTIEGWIKINAWVSGHWITDGGRPVAVPLHVEVSDHAEQPVEGASVLIWDTLCGHTDANGYLAIEHPIQVPVQLPMEYTDEYIVMIDAAWENLSANKRLAFFYTVERVRHKSVSISESETVYYYNMMLAAQFLGISPPISLAERAGSAYLFALHWFDWLSGPPFKSVQLGDEFEVSFHALTAPGLAPAWLVTERVYRGGEGIKAGETWIHSENVYNKLNQIELLSRRVLWFDLHSPALLYVTAPDGSTAGYDPLTGELVAGFPIAVSEPGDEPFQLFVLQPVEGEYLLSVVGTGDGSYNLSVQALDFEGMAGPEITFINAISEDQIHRYGLMLSESREITVTTMAKSVQTATGTGIVWFTASHGTVEDLESLPVSANPPDGYTFPDGLFSFRITGLASGQAVTVTIDLPSPVPAGTKWWKHHDGHWHDYNVPITISGNTITITLTDGGVGDIDDIAGQITDPGGPGYPLSLGYTVGWETQPINKFAVSAPWIGLLAAIMAGGSLLVLRRRRVLS